MASTRRRTTEPSTTTAKRRAPKGAPASAPRRLRDAKAAPPAPTREDVALRAYAIFEREGGGDHEEHWLRAERELTRA